MDLRRKVAVELGIIAVLTTAFLLLFPKRSPAVDVGLAAFALLCLCVSAGYTKNVIWAASVRPVAENGFKRCVIVTLWVTVPPALMFLLIGGFVAYQNGGWPGVADRVFNWRILAAFGGYLPWALRQQTLLQFYLLGRPHANQSGMSTGQANRASVLTSACLRASGASPRHSAMRA